MKLWRIELCEVGDDEFSQTCIETIQHLIDKISQKANSIKYLN